MAGRRLYTDEDRSRVYLELTLHDNNVRRASRMTGVPETTIRDWRIEWDRDGVPPELLELAALEATEFVDDAVRVRNRALLEIERKIPEAKPSELITIVGVLDDKVTRARGLATTRTAVQHELPAPDEIRDALVAAMQGVLEASRDRQAVIEGEIVEPARSALEAPREE